MLCLLPLHPWRWTVRYMEEAFRQGDEEVKQKLQVLHACCFLAYSNANVPSAAPILRHDI